jgi:E3 ubiquitin-protein ligase SHPRH
MIAPFSFWLIFDVVSLLLLVDRDAGLLEEELPDLLPHLRPYQLRAANWMVEREKRNTAVSSPNEGYVHPAPYCVPIDFINKKSRMFYNPFK